MLWIDYFLLLSIRFILWLVLDRGLCFSIWGKVRWGYLRGGKRGLFGCGCRASCLKNCIFAWVFYGETGLWETWLERYPCLCSFILWLWTWIAYAFFSRWIVAKQTLFLTLLPVFTFIRVAKPHFAASISQPLLTSILLLHTWWNHRECLTCCYWLWA